MYCFGRLEIVTFRQRVTYLLSDFRRTPEMTTPEACVLTSINASGQSLRASGCNVGGPRRLLLSTFINSTWSEIIPSSPFRITQSLMALLRRLHVRNMSKSKHEICHSDTENNKRSLTRVFYSFLTLIHRPMHNMIVHRRNLTTHYFAHNSRLIPAPLIRHSGHQCALQIVMNEWMNTWSWVTYNFLVHKQAVMCCLCP